MALDAALRTQGLTLILINPYASETPADIQAQLQAAGYRGLYVQDKNLALCRALGACTTTEVFLLDATRTLLYRGALDDQYGTNYNREALNGQPIVTVQIGRASCRERV